MRRGSIEASAEIAARPVDIYAILADYCLEHPRILTKPYFSELKVEHRGVRAGTIIRLYMHVFGRERVHRQQVTDPDPGRVLVEPDLNTGSVTIFKVPQSLADSRLVFRLRRNDRYVLASPVGLRRSDRPPAALGLHKRTSAACGLRQHPLAFNQQCRTARPPYLND